jgi:hypothetical protein
MKRLNIWFKVMVVMVCQFPPAHTSGYSPPQAILVLLRRVHYHTNEGQMAAIGPT